MNIKMIFFKLLKGHLNFFLLISNKITRNA